MAQPSAVANVSPKPTCWNGSSGFTAGGVDGAKAAWNSSTSG